MSVFPVRLSSAAHKLRWGLSVVGFLAVVRGALRMIVLRLRGPHHAEIRLRSGLILEYDYPRQLPTMLVMFGDLVDPEFDFLREVSREDWIVVDVGAAIGQFTVFSARLPCRIVHAYEPSHENVVSLTRNLERNGITGRVEVHQVALSNSKGEAAFVTTDRTWLSRLGHGEEEGGQSVSVRTLTEEMDRLGVNHVSVLKVNVAGSEPEVIDGAMSLLAGARVDILVLLLGLRSLPWYEAMSRRRYRFFYYRPPEKTLYEVKSFDQSAVLDHRPWPARHIIAVHDEAIEGGILDGIALRRL